MADPSACSALASLTCRGHVGPEGDRGLSPQPLGGGEATSGPVQEATPPIPQPKAAPPHRAGASENDRSKPELGEKERRDHTPCARTPQTSSPVAGTLSLLGRRHVAHDTRSAPPPRASAHAAANQHHKRPGPAPAPRLGKKTTSTRGPRLPPRAFPARQWAESPSQPAPAPQRARANRKGCVCERRRGGGSLRTRRPCSQVPGSRWWPERSICLRPAGGPLPPYARAGFSSVCPRLPRGGGGSSPSPSPGSGGPRDAGPHRVSPAGRCLGRLRRLAHPAAAYQHAAARRGHQPALQRLQVPRPPEEQGELVRRGGSAAGEPAARPLETSTDRATPPPPRARGHGRACCPGLPGALRRTPTLRARAGDRPPQIRPCLPVACRPGNSLSRTPSGKLSRDSL